MFQSEIKIAAKYEDVVARLKKRINKTFFKGYLDKEDTLLYYYSPTLLNPFKIQQVPMMRVDIQNKSDELGELTIKFKVVNLFLVIYGIIHFASWIAFFFIISNSGRGSILPGLTFLIFTGIIPFGIISMAYNLQLTSFKKEITEIMGEIEQRTANKV